MTCLYRNNTSSLLNGKLLLALHTRKWFYWKASCIKVKQRQRKLLLSAQYRRSLSTSPCGCCAGLPSYHIHFGEAQKKTNIKIKPSARLHCCLRLNAPSQIVCVVPLRIHRKVRNSDHTNFLFLNILVCDMRMLFPFFQFTVVILILQPRVIYITFPSL